MSRGIYDKINQQRIPIAGAQVPNVDNALSSTSENPVQNKVIKQALDNKQNELTFDSTPTANSNNPVKSGGVYTAITNLQSNFQDGCDTIVQAVTAKGITPASTVAHECSVIH